MRRYEGLTLTSTEKVLDWLISEGVPMYLGAVIVSGAFLLVMSLT